MNLVKQEFYDELQGKTNIKQNLNLNITQVIGFKSSSSLEIYYTQLW